MAKKSQANRNWPSRTMIFRKILEKTASVLVVMSLPHQNRPCMAFYYVFLVSSGNSYRSQQFFVSGPNDPNRPTRQKFSNFHTCPMIWKQILRQSYHCYSWRLKSDTFWQFLKIVGQNRFLNSINLVTFREIFSISIREKSWCVFWGASYRQSLFWPSKWSVLRIQLWNLKCEDKANFDFCFNRRGVKRGKRSTGKAHSFIFLFF